MPWSRLRQCEGRLEQSTAHGWLKKITVCETAKKAWSASDPRRGRKPERTGTRPREKSGRARRVRTAVAAAVLRRAHHSLRSWRKADAMAVAISDSL
jgi:hypothetical protein